MKGLARTAAIRGRDASDPGMARRIPAKASRASPISVPACGRLTFPSMSELASLVRNIPDWPKQGIQFKDITTLLADPEGLREAIEGLAAPFHGKGVDLVLGTEARGFLFAPAVAMALNAGVVLARKPGKLPWKTIREGYALEYGTDALEVHLDAVKPRRLVLLAVVAGRNAEQHIPVPGQQVEFAGPSLRFHVIFSG